MTEALPSWRAGVAKSATDFAARLCHEESWTSLSPAVSRCSNDEERLPGAKEKEFSLTGANKDARVEFQRKRCRLR
jgi:hypothetical protein